MRKIGIILLLLIISSCNGQENKATNESTRKTVKIANDNIEIVLKKQLLQGTTYNIDEPAAGLQAMYVIKLNWTLRSISLRRDCCYKFSNFC